MHINDLEDVTVEKVVTFSDDIDVFGKVKQIMQINKFYKMI